MKAGMSLDGKISYVRGQGGKITGNISQQYTHELRNINDAILIGSGTAIIDDPSLTTRFIGGRTKDPVRIILDTNLRVPVTAKIFRQVSEAPTWIFCSPDASPENERNLADAGAVIRRVAVDNDKILDLNEILTILAKDNITSILVEGGAKVHAAMLRQNLVDEMYLFIAPFFIGEQGTPLFDDAGFKMNEDGYRLHRVEVKQLGSDALIHGFLSNLIS